MDGEQATSVAAPGFKLLTVWGVVGVGTLIDWLQVISYTLGILYTTILISEWVYKKFWRKKNARRNDGI